MVVHKMKKRLKVAIYFLFGEKMLLNSMFVSAKVTFCF